MIRRANPEYNILVAGVSFRTAGIDIRERFSLSLTEKEELLRRLKEYPSVHEVIVLSTCNRTEIYVSGPAGTADETDVLNTLFSIKKINPDHGFEKLFYCYRGEAAVQQLFTVTAGLDSLIIGERQILGQFKDAVLFSREREMLGRHFNILSNLAIRAGKKAQTETQISQGGSSVSWAAVTLAEKKLGGLRGKSVLVIGAGKMSKINLNLLHKKGAARIYLMNRSLARAEQTARQVNATVIPLSGLDRVLDKVDLCICSTSSPGYVLSKTAVIRALSKRRGRRMILIDISVPRNIDPEINTLKNVQLFVIDQLQKMVTQNQHQRQSAVDSVKQIINAKIQQYRVKITAKGAE
ncbi:MAG: glutamyl-tRNA reductase [Candidatus Omnitrophota bacterium]